MQVMGKGDKSSKRGKIAAGSYGNVRPKPTDKVAAKPAAAPAKTAAKTARKKA